MQLLSHSTRATIRTLTLLFAITSLLLTLITPFVGTAWAAHGPYAPEDGSLDDSGFTQLQDLACSTGDDDKVKGGVKADDVHLDDPAVLEEGSLGSDKFDLCDMWVDSTVDDSGDVWLYAAFTRPKNAGTTHTAIELLNEGADCDVHDYANCNPWENRESGTRIIGFTWQGNDDLVNPTLWTFNGGWDAGQALGTKFEGSTGADGKFGEFAVNLSDTGILPNVNDPEAPCELISAFLPFTLSGLSLTSEMKDVILGDAPPITTCGAITVIKDAGGDDFGDTFEITLTGGSNDPETHLLGHGESFTDSEAKAHSNYGVSEDLAGLDGWTITSISCDDETSVATGEGETELTGITVKVGQTTTCTVTNSPDLPTITLEKEIVNDNGGEATEDDFQGSIDGIGDVDWDVATTVDPGTYTPSETMLVGGYTQDSIVCDDTDAGDTATVGLGDDVTCVITNNDEPGELLLQKTIVDEDDLYPDVTQDDFVPTIDSGDTTWGSHTVDAGDYTIGEHDAAGSTLLEDGTFVHTSTVCDGVETDQVTVSNGETSTCTVTNTAVGAGLTVIKDVQNNWGGQLEATNFPLMVNGDGVDSGVATTFPAGDYTIAEDQQPGYELSDSFCTRDGEPVDGIDGESFDISVGAGETVVCTFVNQDIPATVTLEKTVINDNGGTLEQGAFPSFLDSESLAWDTTINIAAGSHTASETPQDGYEAGDWGGDCAADGTFTAELAGDYVCTITNDDIGSQLTFVKEVINDDGGSATEADFIPTHGYQAFGSDTAISGTVEWTTYDVDAGIHTIGEILPAEGYELIDIVCQRNGDTFASSPENGLEIEIGLDDDVTCTVTNDDLPSTLNLAKEVINDDGGTATEDDFTPTVAYDGTGDASGVTETPDWDSYTVPAGEYTIGELVATGYLQEGVQCDVDGETITGGATATIVLGNDETADCVVTNNDIGPGLTVVKQVVNDDDGSLGAGDFPLEVTGSDEVTTIVESGVSNDLDADTYTIGEQQQDGYELTDLSCVLVTDEGEVPVGELSEDGTTITVDLDLAQSIACTVVNDDIAPLVTLTKEVVNDDGGSLSADDFPVTFDGEDATWGDQFATTVGDHAAAEVQQSGYVAGDWGGDCAADGSLTTEPGGVYECTITNDDVPAGLTVVKDVVNDDNGTLGPEDFPLEITPEGGETQVVDSGAVTTVPAGTYTIGEQQQDNYVLVSIACDNGVAAAEGEETVTVTVANGESVVCTITNDDPEPTIAANLLGPTCDNDTPYLVYDVTVEHTDSTTATIHWFDADGVEQHTDVVEGLAGRVLWPGAEVDDEGNPTDWPGWIFQDDEWVQADDGFAWSRDGASVTVEVNPTTDPVTVEYPPPTPTCDANPPEPEVLGEVFEQPAPQLPTTGIDTGRLAVWSLLITALGVLILVGTAPAAAPAGRRRD